jgi:hypothetical protein
MMIMLGLRIAFAGGRESVARVALTAAGVALGIVLLLLALTAMPALQGRIDRYAWHRTEASSPATAPTVHCGSPSPTGTTARTSSGCTSQLLAPVHRCSSALPNYPRPARWWFLRRCHRRPKATASSDSHLRNPRHADTICGPTTCPDPKI